MITLITFGIGIDGVSVTDVSKDMPDCDALAREIAERLLSAGGDLTQFDMKAVPPTPVVQGVDQNVSATLGKLEEVKADVQEAREIQTQS